MDFNRKAQNADLGYHTKKNGIRQNAEDYFDQDRGESMLIKAFYHISWQTRQNVK